MSNPCKDIYVKFRGCIFSNTFEGSHPYPNEQCKDLENNFLKCERKYKNEKKTLYNDKHFDNYLNIVHGMSFK